MFIENPEAEKALICKPFIQKSRQIPKFDTWHALRNFSRNFPAIFLLTEMKDFDILKTRFPSRK